MLCKNFAAWLILFKHAALKFECIKDRVITVVMAPNANVSNQPNMNKSESQEIRKQKINHRNTSTHPKYVEVGALERWE